MKIRIHSSRLFLILLALASVSAARAAEQEIDLQRTGEGGWPPPVPVSISGFSSEVDGVLKNDLLFMGMKNVGPEEAKFLIAGNNSGRVEARVLERISKNTILAKAYAGSTQRSQAHALADDIALALTGRPGIAQTKITFKVENGPGRSEIYIADYDGHNAQAVTHDQTLVAAPCWAGRSMLFYASYKLGQPCIFSHQLTSGARSAVARFSGANISPAVSPDGNKLAMILSKSGSPNLYVSDLSGGNLKQLTFSREGESSPCWSPDSQTICFVSRKRGPASMFTIGRRQAAAGHQPRAQSHRAGLVAGRQVDRFYFAAPRLRDLHRERPGRQRHRPGAGRRPDVGAEFAGGDFLQRPQPCEKIVFA